MEESAPCCSRTDLPGRCESHADKQCALYDSSNSRIEASRAIRKYLGGNEPNDNNAPFYHAFKVAWFKSTINGHSNLKPVMDSC